MKAKKLLASILAVCMVMSTMSFSVLADEKQLVLSEDKTATVEGESALSITEDTTVIVEGDVTLTGAKGGAGIYVAEGATLTIKGDGTLTAIGNNGEDTVDNGAAGIGGTYANGNSGNIIIDGATVIAKGYGVHGSGIGSGSGKVAGEIKIINDADVTAYGGYYADGAGTLLQSSYGKTDPEGGAAIGGGGKTASTIAPITIENSKVIAYGGSKAAGIGANFWCSVSSITITNSDVTAQGGSSSAAIGTSRAGDTGVSSNITITDSTVTATGGAYGAGIGAGYNNDSLGNGAAASALPETKIAISGGIINAKGGEGGAAIGGGYKSDNVSISIADDAEITATAGELVSGKTVENGGAPSAIGTGANGSGKFENSPVARIADTASITAYSYFGGKDAIEGMTNQEANESGNIKVKQFNNVIQASTAEEFETAIADALAGDTINLIADIIVDEALTIPNGVVVTVAEGSTLHVLDTLTNNGTISGAVSVDVMVYVVATVTPYKGVSYDVTATKKGALEGNAPIDGVAYAISLDGGNTWIADTTNGKAQAVTVKTDGTTVVSASFQSAFTSAKTGETVHMLKDAHVQSTNPKKNNGPLRSYYGLILEGNGHTIYTDLESSGASNEYATIKFTSYLAGTGPEVNPVLKNVTIDSQNNAKADLDFVSGDVTFTVAMCNVNLLGNCQYASFAWKSPSLIINKSNVEIYDCSIPGWDASSAKAINLYSGEYTLSLNSKCKVYGGIYIKDPTNYLATEDLIAKFEDDGKYHVVSDPKYGMVAGIGNTYYKTLAEAITAAQPNDTITLLTDVTEDVNVNKSVTIDGANFKYTGNISAKGNANSTDVTVKNVNFVNGTGYAITTNTIKSITVENCTVSNYGYGFLYANRSTPTVVVKNVTVDGANYGFHWVYGTSATLENVKMTNVTNGLLIQNYADKTITLKNCNLTNINIWERDGKSGVQTFKFEGNNTVPALSTSQYAKYVLADGEAVLTACEGLDVTATNENYNVIYENGSYKVAKVAKIGEKHYCALQDAVDAAKAGDTIELLSDVTEKVVIPAPAAKASTLNANAIVIDLAGHTLNGYILIQDANKNIEIKNGNIVNEDSDESAIESNATLTVTNVNITSARHAINIEGNDANNKAKAYINGGNFTLIPYGPGRTQNTIGAENAVVTIDGGVFTGPKGTTTDSGAAVAAKKNADVTINGGKFAGGKNSTLSKDATATLVVNGGAFDQDVSAFVAADKEVVKLGDDKGYAYPYIVAPKAASAIKVELVEVSNGLYNIVLHSADTYRIHEFVVAQFTFKNDSETFGGSEMQYTVSGYKDANNLIDTVAQKTVVDGEERYIIRIKDAEKVENRLKGHSLTIGQVSFIGQGTIKFSITNGEIDTTWQNTNLGRYYKSAEGTVDLTAATDVGGSVADITKNVAISVTYNHELVAAWDNDEITVTLKDAYGEIVGTDDISDGEAKFDNVKIGRITVTLEAPGFRKFVYETTLDEDDDDTVVLSFWNDVKKENHKLSIEKDATAVAHNFVVGDIVMDYIVDRYDLAAVTSYYGMYNIVDNAKYIKYDLNRDGAIDIRDVQYVLHTMGK